MARAGRQGEAPWLRDILRQVGGEHPKAKLAELADSLVARAIDPAGRQAGSDAYVRGVNATNTLVQAGTSESLNGRPYSGAFDGLVEVHRSTAHRNIRARVLGGMLSTPSHARAVSYLQATAESGDSTALDAMQFLITDANGGGGARRPTASERLESVEALKALSARGRVVDGRAAKFLSLWLSRVEDSLPSRGR